MTARVQNAPVSPDPGHAASVASLLRFMEEHEAAHGPQHGEAARPQFFLSGSGEDDRVEINEQLYGVLKQAVEALNRGQSVRIAASDQQVTTQQAGEILGISRPTVVQLIETGELPAHVPGAVRRKLLLSDVLAYRDKIRARRTAFIAESAEEFGDLAQDEVKGLLQEAKNTL